MVGNQLSSRYVACSGVMHIPQLAGSKRKALGDLSAKEPVPDEDNAFEGRQYTRTSISYGRNIYKYCPECRTGKISAILLPNNRVG